MKLAGKFFLPPPHEAKFCITNILASGCTLYVLPVSDTKTSYL